ncbi:MAG: 50S ribosomal protein L6 [Rubricoccaceae bacterium]|nr:50S ribosomal protein L6 [Rubricoccaceae bacterium]
MSRIGQMPVTLPDGVNVDISKTNFVTVSGPKGELGLQVDPDLSVSLEDGVVSVTRPTDQKRHRAMHGLYRALINNLVEGVTEGYKKELEVIGVGYRAEVNNGVLELALGYSHPIYFLPPEGIAISAVSERGKNPTVTIEGIDKQLVGQVAAKIRGLRPPEPYKGKGIRYVNEYVRRKAGKTAAR